MSKDHVTVLYPVFINIAPNSVMRPRVIVFININNTEHVIVTLKPDIYQDPDV